MVKKSMSGAGVVATVSTTRSGIANRRHHITRITRDGCVRKGTEAVFEARVICPERHY